MFTYGSNFSGANFGHPVAENNNTGHNGYPFGAPSGNSESVTRVDQAGNLDLDTTIVSPSTAAAENWWLGLSLNGGSSQYPESTVLDAAWDGFTDLYDFQTVPMGGNGVLETNNVEGSVVQLQRYPNIPEYRQPTMTGPSPVIQPALSLLPSVIPGLDQSLSWGYPLPPTTSTISTGSHRSGVYDQPSTAPGPSGQWPSLPPSNPTATNDTMWQHQQPHATQDYSVGSNPYMNADLSTAAASSPGPQRSKKRAARKGKEAEKSKWRRKRAAKKSLPPDIDWVRTRDRFYWEMIQVYSPEPPGGLPTPEAAYANINKFITEDLHRSPLMVKDLGVKPGREEEQYLTGILNLLHPAREGEKRDVQRLLDQVAGEVEHGLFMINDAAALLDGPSNETKQEDLDDSEKGVQRRRTEKGRRDASHETLKRMSYFFKAPPRSLSRNKVLFFAITYLLFGAEALGYGFVIARPKLQITSTYNRA